MNTRLYRLAALTAAVLVAGAMSAGCGEDPTGGAADSVQTTSFDQLNLDQPYGGLTYTDEPTAFGDATISADASAEEQADANVDDEQEMAVRFGDVQQLLDRPDVHRTYLRIVWGMLDANRDSGSTAPGLLDWSGGLGVSEGALIVKRTILFEPLRQNDHLVLPRADRQHLQWVSHTGGHIDGVVVCVLSRPDSLGEVHGSVSFQTPLLSKSFDVASLDGLDETVLVDDQGNGVHFTAVSRAEVACPSGFMAGRWTDLPDRDGGIFRGLWLTESGALRGFIKGRYGVNTAGEHVFAGKLIDDLGRIRGLCGGTYAGNGDGTGSYQGRWVNRAGTVMGQMAGEYRAKPADTTTQLPMGFFQGRWKELCEQPTAL